LLAQRYGLRTHAAINHGADGSEGNAEAYSCTSYDQ
jgi:hypothetical protein